MNLTEALNRRADRGPYRSYEDVITAANAQHTVSPTIEQEKAGPYVHDVPLMPLDRATPPRRPFIPLFYCSLILCLPPPPWRPRRPKCASSSPAPGCGTAR